MAVKVKRERPDQRRHHRVTAPMMVDAGGHRVRAADWSLGGLRVEKFPGRVPMVGSEMPLELTLPFQGFDVTFPVRCEVVRANPKEGMFAVRYIEIGERERELMSHFIEELVRGAMGSVEDTIQRIDVPVTPASLEPDKPRIADLPPARWPVKTIAMSAIYGLAGLLIFGYAGMLGYSNLVRLEVQTAVISAPVETVTAQADGRVAWTGLKPGDRVKAGEVILNLIDNQLEREIDLAEISVTERKAQLAYQKRRFADELERAQSFATVEMKNVKQTRLDLESVAAQLKVAEAQYNRLKILHSKGFTTEVKLEEAEKLMVTLRKTLERSQVELASRVEMAGQNVGKRLFTGDNVVGDVAQIEAQVRLAEHEIQIAQQRYITQLNHRERLAVRAPFEGTILQLPHFDHGSVKKGDTIAVIEQRKDRQILAFLTQDEANKVGIGDEALVFLPALGETLKGRIRQIDRTTGFIREQDQRQAPGYAWRGPLDRSARVSIQFNDSRKVDDVERYRSGLPAVVVFERRSTNSLFSSIARSISLAL